VREPVDFSVSIEDGGGIEDGGRMLLVRVEGELDAYTAPMFRHALEPHDPAARQVVIDLSRVTLLDSSGLASLIGLRNRAVAGGRSLGLVCPQRELRNLLGITGLRPSFAVGEDLARVQTALAELGRNR